MAPYFLDYLEQILKVLSTFEIDCTQARLRRPGRICFEVHDEQKSIRFADFAIFLGIYDRDFISSMEYPRLALDFPTHVTPYSAWDVIMTGEG